MNQWNIERRRNWNEERYAIVELIMDIILEDVRHHQSKTQFNAI